MSDAVTEAGRDAMRLVAEVVWEGPLPEGHNPYDTVQAFNQTEGRQQSEVVAVFDEAIRRVDAMLSGVKVKPRTPPHRNRLQEFRSLA